MGDGVRHRLGDGQIMRTREIALPLAAVAAAFVLTAGCGSSKPPVCSDASALQTSVQNLKDVSIGKGSLSTLSNDLSTIQKQLTTLSNSAKGQFGSQITGLQTSIASLRPAVTAAVADPSASTLAAVATRIPGVVSAANTLQSAVKNTC
jgi:hypothetical protein